MFTPLIRNPTCAIVLEARGLKMYITKDQLEQRLSKTDLLIVEKTRKPRSIDPDKLEARLSDEDRVAIGILGNSDLVTHKEAAEILGVSTQTVSNNSRGLTSPTIGVDHELKEAVQGGVAKIAQEKLRDNKQIEDQLLTNLAAALGHVSNNLHNTDASEASKIAVDMSKILDKVSGASEGKNRTAIIINVPSMREERSYQTIDV
jgi:transcriptional regulator with XRE-family HTH domain